MNGVQDQNGHDQVEVDQENQNHNVSDSDPGTPPAPPNDRDAMSATARKRNIDAERVLNLIQAAANHGATVLDLCNRSINTIPNELLELSNLQVCLQLNLKSRSKRSFFNHGI